MKCLSQVWVTCQAYMVKVGQCSQWHKRDWCDQQHMTLQPKQLSIARGDFSCEFGAQLGFTTLGLWLVTLCALPPCRLRRCILLL